MQFKINVKIKSQLPYSYFFRASLFLRFSRIEKNREIKDSRNKILAKFTQAKFNTLVTNLCNKTNESKNVINKLVPRYCMKKLPPEDYFEDLDDV